MDEKAKKGCGIGCLGIFAIIVIVITVLVLSVTGEEKLTDAEITEINTIINNFEADTITYINATKGIVKKIEMLDVKDSDTYSVNVYIDEASWAKATESEKTSVAATIGRQMEELASPTSVFVTLISAQNKDKLAEPKLTSSGYKIVR